LETEKLVHLAPWTVPENTLPSFENDPEKPRGSYSGGAVAEVDCRDPPRFTNAPDIDMEIAAGIPASWVVEISHLTWANLGMDSGASHGLSLQRLQSASLASIIIFKGSSRPKHL
jgi:hypothetical protein